MREHSDQGQDRRGASAAVLPGEVSASDSATTRRALLTGGAVVAGAAVATVAASEKASAADFVVLGQSNTTGTNTAITNTAGTKGFSATAHTVDGIGLFGTSNNGRGARGVQQGRGMRRLRWCERESGNGRARLR